MEPESMTESFMFIMGTFLFYLLVLGAEILPGPAGAAIALAFFVFWLGYPVALHYDRKYVAENSEWRPSRWYYLGFLPGYLGLVFVGYYVYKRREKFEAEPVE